MKKQWDEEVDLFRSLCEFGWFIPLSEYRWSFLAIDILMQVMTSPFACML